MMHMGHVVIAPDKFKGTLSASEVAGHLAAGLHATVAGLEAVAIPVADGGDGTVDAAVAAGFRRVELGVRGPLGKPVTAAFGLLNGMAVIESAQACGLDLLRGQELSPLTATTRGVGELVVAAARMGAKQVAIGLGGTATTDGGAGLVQALGGRLQDADLLDLPPGGAALAHLDRLDRSRMRDFSAIEFLLASDVNNPLLGPDG